MEKEESNERMPGQSGFLPLRGLVLAEEQEAAAASGSGQLPQQLRVVVGRRESLKPTTASRVCAASDRTRFPPGPARVASGWLSLGFSREDRQTGWSRLGRRRSQVRDAVPADAGARAAVVY